MSEYEAFRRFGDHGREIEHRRGPDPYPRATARQTLEELRRRRDEIMRLASSHGASTRVPQLI